MESGGNRRERAGLAARLTAAILLAVEGVLALLHARFTWPDAGTHPPDMVVWFDMGHEANVPTAFSVLQLLLLAALLLAIARVEATARGKVVWSGIAVVTLFLAADEALQIHEAAGDWLGELMSRSSPDGLVGRLRAFGSYYWILIYGPVALPAGVALVAFLHRELGSRWRLASSGLVLSLVGALGVDYLEGRYGTPNHERIPILLFGRFFRFDVFLVEEMLEMVGVTLLVAALAAHAVAVYLGEKTR